MAESHKGRNYCLDFIKGMACICIVFMHCKFPGTLGNMFQCVTRFGVPYFFMISGYFSYYEDGRKFDAGKKVKHILIIAVAASVFYLVVGIAEMLILKTPFSFSVRQIASFLIFNQPIFIAEHLWFLYALIYVYILYAIVDRFNLHKIAYYSIPVLLLGYIALAQVRFLITGHATIIYYRNFLMEGFPVFMIGHLIHKYKEKLITKLTNIHLIILISVFTLLCVAECLFLGRDFGANIFTFPQLTAIFIFAVKNSTFMSKNILTDFGKKYSLFVYVLHWFVWKSVELLFTKTGLTDYTATLYLMPFAVAILSVLLSIIVEKAISAIYGRNRNKEVRA